MAKPSLACTRFRYVKCRVMSNTFLTYRNHDVWLCECLGMATIFIDFSALVYGAAVEANHFTRRTEWVYYRRVAIPYEEGLTGSKTGKPRQAGLSLECCTSDGSYNTLSRVNPYPGLGAEEKHVRILHDFLRNVVGISSVQSDSQLSEEP